MKIKVTKNRKFCFAISLALILVGVISLCTLGLNLGIDFTGGVIMTVDMNQPFDVSDVRQVLVDHKVNDAPVSKSGETEAVIRMQDTGDANDQSDVRDAIFEDLKAIAPGAEVRQVERVGEIAGADLIRNAALSVAIACVLMLIYISFRFTFMSGVTAVLALIHDVFLMVAVVSLFQLRINSSFIAACLTIIGYSINNTIVIFDRIRDNLKRTPAAQLDRGVIVDLSVNQSMTRSINTSVTTILTIGMVALLGVDSIREFTIPILAGLVVGTYSSIFIAPSLWAVLSDFAAKRKGHHASGQKKGQKKTASGYVGAVKKAKA
ncbi:MAG: protein translocase subunit SecF [Christensenellales bacterium]|jgi:preprotein translocase subunit SecF